MPFRFNPFTGNFDEVVITAAAAGSDTQVQYNDGGSLSGSADLTWDDSTKELGIGGDINLDDGGTYTTTIQQVTPTANRTISFPDATGTVALVAGSNGQLLYNNAGALGGVSALTFDGTSLTALGRLISSVNGAPEAPPVALTGTWFSGGTPTTTKPAFLIEPAGTTSTSWSTAGTGLGVNAPSGFTGNLLDLQTNGTSYFRVTDTGFVSVSRGALSSTLTHSGNALILTGAGNAINTNIVSASFLTLSAAGNINLGNSVVIQNEGSHISAQRNGTNAQTTRIYDTYTSDTDYHRVTIATARATLSNVSGASVTATGLIPAGAVVMGVTSKVTTGLGTGNGTTGYKIGTASDDDRWGDITGTAAGTTSDNRDWTAGTIECFPAATDVIVTATGGNFDGTGVIYLSVQYMAGQAD